MGFSKAYLEDKMANGINDILSVYRQSLASERQTRMAEMQLSLSALQFEAQQRFRESGRRREDALGSLEYATASTKEALSQDSNLIYSKIASIKPIAEADYDETTGAMKKSNKIVGKLEDLGYSLTDATQIVTIANQYGLASKNPALAVGAQQMAIELGTRVARDYDTWQREGFAKNTKEYQPKSPLLTAMEKSGVMYKGTDALQRDLSVDAFIGVAQATQALENIETERMEMGTGDYSLDRPLTVGALETSGDEIDFASLAADAGVSLGLTTPGGAPVEVDIKDEVTGYLETGGTKEGAAALIPVHQRNTDAEIMESVAFLPDEDKLRIEKELADLTDLISDKVVGLDSLYTEREDSISKYKLYENQLDEAKQRRQYFYDMGDSEKERQVAKEVTKLRNIVTGQTQSNLAKEYYASDEGAQRGLEGRGNLKQGLFGTNPAYEGTVTKEIIELSKEIKDLQIKKDSFAAR